MKLLTTIDAEKRLRTSQQVLREYVDTEEVRILLIEDEELQAQSLRRGLQAEGFEVDVIDNGRDGLAQAVAFSYAAIILDVMLPGLNGYLVAKHLRAEGVWTPILMLTAKDGEFDEAEAFDYGVDDFLRKPFSFVVLVARLRSMLRRGNGPRPVILSYGSVEYDPANYRCLLRGQEVDLSAREADLLAALLRRRDSVSRKIDLLTDVWGPDFDGDANVVEVYVGYLRKKLGQDFIHTVRGVGYRLNGDA